MTAFLHDIWALVPAFLFTGLGVGLLGYYVWLRRQA